MVPNATVATQPTTNAQQDFKLPTLVFGRVELRRLSREIDILEGYIQQAKVREAGQPTGIPKVSRLLDGFAGENNCNLLVDADRNKLQAFLKELDSTAPVMHLSFAADPSSAFVAKVVAWLRMHIHPYILIQLGLQPNITAGCIARVNSKMLDLSLREFFNKQRGLLIKELSTPDVPTVVAETVPTATATQHVVPTQAQPSQPVQPAAQAATAQPAAKAPKVSAA